MSLALIWNIFAKQNMHVHGKYEKVYRNLLGPVPSLHRRIFRGFRLDWWFLHNGPSIHLHFLREGYGYYVRFFDSPV